MPKDSFQETQRSDGTRELQPAGRTWEPPAFEKSASRVEKPGLFGLVALPNIVLLNYESTPDEPITAKPAKAKAENLVSAEPTVSQREKARDELIKAAHTFGPSEAKLEMGLALFDLRATHKGLGNKAIHDTFTGMTRIAQGGSGTEDRLNRLNIVLEMADHLGSPTKGKQANYGTCVYSSLQRMMYAHAPGKAAHFMADSLNEHKYTGADDVHVSFPTGDAKLLWDEKRGADDRVFQSAAQNLTLQNIPKFDPYGYRSSFKLSYLADYKGERVLYMGAPIDDISSERHLNSIKSCHAGAWAYQAITGDKTQPVYVSRIEGERVKGSTLLPEMKVEELAQFEQTLTALKSQGALPVMLDVHTSNPPWFEDSGRAEPGGHAVVLMDYDPAKKLAAVDNSWNDSVDHLGEPGDGGKISVSQLFASMARPVVK